MKQLLLIPEDLLTLTDFKKLHDFENIFLLVVQEKIE